MTVEEIRENLLKVLSSAVQSQAAVRKNDTPLLADRMLHSLAVERQSHQVTAVKICCKAAGIDEETIREVITLCAL